MLMKLFMNEKLIAEGDAIRRPVRDGWARCMFFLPHGVYLPVPFEPTDPVLEDVTGARFRLSVWERHHGDGFVLGAVRG
jgi:hypothetical protein